MNLQSLTVVSAAFALVTLHIDVREKMHLDLLHTLSLAGLAPATFDIEAESAGLVATYLGFLGFSEQGADGVESTRVGRRVGTRCAPDGRLVDFNDAVDVLDAGQSVVCTGFFT